MTTWNPSDKGANVTLSNGNLTATGNASFIQGVRATTFRSKGKYYYEISCAIVANFTLAGFADAGANIASDYIGDIGNNVSAGMNNSSGALNNAGGGISVTGAASTFVSGDVFGFALDFDAGKLWISKNGTYLSSGNPAGGTNTYATFTANPTWCPAGSFYQTAAVLTLKTTNFSTAPPSGFFGWDTDPTLNIYNPWEPPDFRVKQVSN